jgi:hypothetical protein
LEKKPKKKEREETKIFVLHNEVVTGGRVLFVASTGGYHEVS